MRDLLWTRLVDCGADESLLDVVAIGKAAREMTSALDSLLGDRILRRLVVCEKSTNALGDLDHVHYGDHPIPSDNSERCGQALLEFLREPSAADGTLFLISGGASSLCVVPSPPVTTADLAEIFRASVASGADITTLNRLRAAVSRIAGGAVLRDVRTARSWSLILVDNVVSGARWVASALTYDSVETDEELVKLLDAVGISETRLAERIRRAHVERVGLLDSSHLVEHENLVLAEPLTMCELVKAEASRRGYRVVDIGAAVSGDVSEVSRRWSTLMSEELKGDGPVAIIGVGEVTVKVSGSGRGGRCQEFAWSMAEPLRHVEREVLFLARSSDGRDYIEGVSGAWVEHDSYRRSEERGHGWRRILEDHDTHPALVELGHIIEGSHTGWNLCDVYLLLIS